VEIQIRAGAQPRSDGEENKADGAYKEQNGNLLLQFGGDEEKRTNPSM
jgi:hypothetical protein